MSPTVTGGDVGDFLTAVYTRTLPHPPGFPLYTIVGIGFSLLPLPALFAWKVGLLSAVATAGAATIIYLSLYRLVKSTLLSLLGALLFGFLYPVWLYAEVAEAFAFTLFFQSLLIYVGIVFYQTRSKKIFYLLAFVTGLALSTHQVLLLLLPPLFVLIFVVQKKLLLNLRILATAVVCFFLGLLPYIYVPLAAYFDTYHKWGELHSSLEIIRFMLRLNYGWIATPSKLTDATDETTLGYTFYWLKEANFILPVVIVGLFASLKRFWQISLFLLLGFFLMGPLYAVYSSLPPKTDELLGAIERFYLFSAVYLVFFFIFGVQSFYNVFERKIAVLLHHKLVRGRLLSLFLLSLFFIPAWFAIKNFDRVNLRNVFIGEYVAVDSLTPLPKDSILLTTTDTTSLNIYFTQQSLHKREDITHLSRAPLSLYVNNHHALRVLRDDLLQKYTSLTPFEASMLALLRVSGSSSKLFSEKPFFQDDPRLLGLRWIPYGLMYRLSSGKAIQSKDEYIASQKNAFSLMHIVAIEQSNEKEMPLLLRSIPKRYARQLIFIAQYITDYYKSPRDAMWFLGKAKKVYPQTVEPYEMIGKFYAESGRCSEAREEFSIATKLDPLASRSYEKMLSQFCPQPK